VQGGSLFVSHSAFTDCSGSAALQSSNPNIASLSPTRPPPSSQSVLSLAMPTAAACP
jgi:hypothetical protein